MEKSEITVPDIRFDSLRSVVGFFSAVMFFSFVGNLAALICFFKFCFKL